jgi:hypothetical protein
MLCGGDDVLLYQLYYDPFHQDSKNRPSIIIIQFKKAARFARGIERYLVYMVGMTYNE